MSCCKHNAVNLSALVLLADTDLAKEANVSDKLPKALQEVMKKRLAARDIEKAEQAADSIIAIIDSAESLKIAKVQEIREARRTIANAQRTLSSIDAAIAHGNATSNYLPLAGIVIPQSVLLASGVPAEKMLFIDSDVKKKK